MKLFVKHLLRCTAKRPLQPILLFLMILLSCTLVISMLTVQAAVEEEFDLLSAASYGNSDLVIRLGGDSRTRFMVCEDAERLLGEGVTVVGAYDLVVSLPEGGDTVTAVATELDRVGEIFPLTFSSRAPLPSHGIGEAVYITEEIAKDRALSVGDTLVLSLFGKEAVYTVYGISPTPFVSERDLLIDVRGAMRALSASTPLLSAFGKDFAPGSTLYVDLHGAMSTVEATALLQSDSLFSDKSFSDTESLQSTLLNRSALSAFIALCTLLSCLLASALLYSCFFLLSNERKKENEAFLAAGAAPRSLALAQYVELLFYWLLAAPLSILLSIPASRAITGIAGFRYAAPRLSPASIALGVLLLLAVSLLTVTLFLTGGPKPEPRGHRWSLPILLALALTLSVAALAVHGKAALPLGGAAITLLLLAFFFAVPPLFHLTANALARLRRLPFSVLYAAKNATAVKALRNTTRLFAVLVALVIAAFGIVASEEGSLASARMLYRGDYAVLNANDRCCSELQAPAGAELVVRVHQSSATYGTDGTSPLTLLSVEDAAILGEQFGVPALPKGEEAYLSSVVAEKLSIGIGDRFAVRTAGRTLTLTLVGTIDPAISVLLLNGEHHGLSPNMIVAVAKSGEEATLSAALGTVAGREMATVLPVATLMENEMHSVAILVSCTRILVLSLFALALIGILDNLFASYRERRGELALYRLAGASAGTVRCMVLAEIALTLLSGLLIGILAGGLLLLILQRVLLPVSFDLGAGLRLFLRGFR